MKKRRTYNMVLASIFGAITFILGMIPNIGFIRVLPGVAITIVHIPVIIAAFVLPLTHVIGLGFIFGLSSLIVSATQAQTPFDQSFIYPWISILPRMLFALITVYILKLFVNIKKFKFSKHIIFIIISVITSFALFFGVKEVVTNVNYNKANNKQEEIFIYENDLENFDEDVYNEMELEYNLLLNEANERYNKVMIITYISLSVAIIITILLYAYLVYFSKYKEKYFYIPSVFILSTFLHTIFVIGAVIIFRPKIFYDTLGTNISLINILLGIALSNGLVEAIFGAIIGSPIVVALDKRLEFNK